MDDGFDENIRSILGQSHPHFRVVFVVESDSDPAFAALFKLGAQPVLVAGPARDCGQKVHNLSYAIQLLGNQADVYVFCDSDAHFPETWLETLTKPLEDKSITVASGYRWYVANRFHLPTLLRSAWNASVLGLLGGHKRNFAWGGSLAIRRETFDRLNILNGAWRGSVSDDYAITRAVQRAGSHVTFVPECLIPSHGECSFSELLEFSTRQIIITRVYHPALWRIAFFAQTLFNVTFIWLTFAMLSGNGVAAGLWLVIFSLAGIKSAIRQASVRRVLRDHSLSRYAWFYILSAPIVALLYQYNMVRSALTSDIEWRQIHYSLISPHETRVRRSSAGAS